jgi:2-phosphosulfolactate phosphatase
MPSTLAVHFLPALVEPDELAGDDVVMMDVLRASTTIAYALAAGAVNVVPCFEIDEARQVAAGFEAGAALLGGERGGRPIAGFDLGNSPHEYTHGSVAGKTIVFTTTNGTAALMQCRKAARVMIGSFVNLSAVVEELAGRPSVHLLCAGTQGRITREDVLCAGAISDLLLQRNAEISLANDSARIALEVWRTAVAQPFEPRAASEILKHALCDTQGGRNLAAIGLARDIDAASEVDRFDIVPRLDIAQWRIVVA